MGPTLLFDKSFLQTLSEDEAVLLDQFFSAVIAPVFYVETLADLEKKARSGRSPEDEVRIIAKKIPLLHSAPMLFHPAWLRGNSWAAASRGRENCYVPGGAKD